MEQTLVIRRTGEMNREEIRRAQEAANRKALLVKRGRTAVLIGLNVLVALFVLLPLLYAVSVAFMPSSELFTTQMNLLPSSPTLENFRQALIKVPLARFVANSFMGLLPWDRSYPAPWRHFPFPSWILRAGRRFSCL